MTNRDNHPYLALARKWRPKKFADLIGQNTTVTILKNIIERKHFHHAYLLTGTRGVGKTTIARIISKAFNCNDLINSEPCTICNSCRQIDNGTFIDVIEIDAASNTGVDNVRELIDNARYVPSEGRYKVYIIDEVHMLSRSAFNALLKTLEEPPQHIIFILATTEINKVPITVLSRCLQLKLKNIPPPEISRHLAYILNNEQIGYQDVALEIISNAAQGSMRDALSLLDQAIALSSSKQIDSSTVIEMLGITDENVIYSLLNAIANSDTLSLIKHANELFHNGNNLEEILKSISQKLCQISMIQLCKIDCNPELAAISNQISINDTQLYFEICNLGITQMQPLSDKYPTFVMTLLRMAAFKIGSDKSKELLIKNTNLSTVNLDLASNKIQQTPNNNVQTPVTNSTNKAISQQNCGQEPLFDGNWFKLISKLQQQLGYLYPFLENSQLKEYTLENFNILIDSRYSSSFTSKALQDLQHIFSTFFKTAITVNCEFTNQIKDTLKEQITTEKNHKQQLAEQAIYNDKNLSSLLERFSATIIPGSIKPV